MTGLPTSQDSFCLIERLIPMLPLHCNGKVSTPNAWVFQIIIISQVHHHSFWFSKAFCLTKKTIFLSECQVSLCVASTK